MNTRPLLIGCLSLLVTLAACQSNHAQVDTTATEPGETTADAGPVPTDNAALLDYVGDQPYVTAEVGYRVAYILWKGDSFAGEYGELTDELVAGRIIDDCWNYGPHHRLARADIGYMVCRAANINTGLNWQLLGLGRYAYRELIYHDIAKPAGELGLVSGGEFQGIVRRADAYRAAHASASDQAQLGAAP